MTLLDFKKLPNHYGFIVPHLCIKTYILDHLPKWSWDLLKKHTFSVEVPFLAQIEQDWGFLDAEIISNRLTIAFVLIYNWYAFDTYVKLFLNLCVSYSSSLSMPFRGLPQAPSGALFNSFREDVHPFTGAQPQLTKAHTCTYRWTRLSMGQLWSI